MLLREEDDDKGAHMFQRWKLKRERSFFSIKRRHDEEKDSKRERTVSYQVLHLWGDS